MQKDNEYFHIECQLRGRKPTDTVGTLSWLLRNIDQAFSVVNLRTVLSQDTVSVYVEGRRVARFILSPIRPEHVQ
jgi:hypothetical protein